MRHFEQTQVTGLRQQPLPQFGRFQTFAETFGKPQVPIRQFASNVRFKRSDMHKLFFYLILNAKKLACMVCHRLRDWKTVGLTPMPTFSKEASYHPLNSRIFPRRARVRSVNEDPLRKWVSKRVSNVRSHLPISSTSSVDGSHWPRITTCGWCYRRMIGTKSRSMI